MQLCNAGCIALAKRSGARLRLLATERLYVLSLGSQQGNRHVHWHVVPLPPGVPYREQQLALLAKSMRGVLPFDRQRNAALAARIRANLDTRPTRSTPGETLKA